MWSQSYYPYIQDEQYGIVDSSGQVQISAAYDQIWHTINHQLFLLKKDRKYGLLAHDLDELLPLDFEYLHVNSDKSIVFKYEGKYGLLDGNLHVIIPDTLMYIGKMKYGASLILNQDGYSYIDSTGKILYDLKADAIFDHELPDHLHYYKKNDFYGFINLKAQVVYPPIAKEYFEFESNTAFVLTPNSAFYIDENGKQIRKTEELDSLQTVRVTEEYQFPIPAAYRSHTPVKGLFEKKGKYGVKNKKGNVIIPAKYTNILLYSDPETQYFYFIASIDERKKYSRKDEKYLFDTNGKLLKKVKSGYIKPVYYSARYVDCETVNFNKRDGDRRGVLYDLYHPEQSIEYDYYYQMGWYYKGTKAGSFYPFYFLKKDNIWYTYDQHLQLIYPKN